MKYNAKKKSGALLHFFLIFGNNKKKSFFFIDNNKLINASHFRSGLTFTQRKQEIQNQLLAKISKLTNTNTNRT